MNSVKMLFDIASGTNNGFSELFEVCDKLDQRKDCSDFDIQALLRIMYRYRDKLDAEAETRIRRTLLAFKYWIDEPGTDSMCYWSENHQLLFAAAEYLAGQFYPNEWFPNGGMTGKEHMEKARGRILQWLTWKWKYGFTEWQSNVYYAPDIGPLCNLIELCEDEEICRKSEIVLDLLMLEFALYNFKGIFGGTKGRNYEVHKKEPRKESTRGITHLLWGETKDSSYSLRLSSYLLLSKRYRIPEGILQIGMERGPVELKASSGLDLEELEGEGIYGDKPEGILFIWGMEALHHPRCIENTLNLMDRCQLYDNSFLRGLRRWRRSLLRKSGLLPPLIRYRYPHQAGAALQRANTYMYKTERFSLSTVQSYQPGCRGNQQHVWQATLSDDITVFTTHPGLTLEEHLANPKKSPNYWVGNGRMPHAVQWKHIMMAIYHLPEKPGSGEPAFPLYTHAYFPKKKFDEALIDKNYAFGRFQHTYIALIGGGELQFHPQDDTDLIQKGRQTFWICEIGTEEENGSFEAFIGHIRSANVTFEGSRLDYNLKAHTFRLEYGKGFYYNERKMDTNYNRFDTPYCTMERKSEICSIRSADFELFLDFDRLIRDSVARSTTESGFASANVGFLLS